MLIRNFIGLVGTSATLMFAPLYAGTVPVAGTKATRAALIPDRLLTCSVRHITNFDPTREQSASELNYDTVHALTLFLARIPVRTKAPPESFEKAEPVNRRTRITADPDHIAPQKGGRFERVIDLWPERTELSAPLGGHILNAIVISNYDAANGTANFTMTRASELTHFDPNHIYQGQCNVRIGAAANKPPMV